VEAGVSTSRNTPSLQGIGNKSAPIAKSKLASTEDDVLVVVSERRSPQPRGGGGGGSGCCWNFPSVIDPGR